MDLRPQLTRDLARARADLDAFGYCLVADALGADELAALRERLVAQADAEARIGVAYRDGGDGQRVVDDFGRLRQDAFTEANGGVNQRVWMLANKGRVFRDLVVHPLVDDLVGHVLGQRFVLSQMSANIAKPGGVRMGLHTDQWWMPQPVRPGHPSVKPGDVTRAAAQSFVAPDPSLGIAPAVVVNTMWMLSDFTATNGATEVVPGSHLTGAHPPPGDQSGCGIVAAEAPAGSLMVFDGRLWHGTGACTANDVRLGLLTTFCGPQFRAQENQTLGIDPELWDELEERLRYRLGFVPWNAYGRIESPAAAFVHPLPERIGELH
jgi:ectoine hydroxylase-related dioxygenase (phytanoyl-CoA dioxygenase family)